MNAIAAISLIALTIIGEARLQPLEGQVCLALTVRNRMNRSGWEAERVVFQNYQYRVWDKGVVADGYGLRLRWLRCVASGRFPDDPWCMEPVLMIGSPDYWREIWEIAESVYFGTAVPPEGCENVENYDNLDAFWDGEDPPWIAGYERAVVYGDHTFYRPKEPIADSEGQLENFGHIAYYR